MSNDKMMKQGWAGLAFWMALGFLLESLMAYKAPLYLEDSQRRELFRLAHTHGTLLSAVLILAALTEIRWGTLPSFAKTALRSGALLMPTGFLLAGIWHPEGDPGVAIWLVPPGALLMIFGVVATAICVRRSSPR